MTKKLGVYLLSYKRPEFIHEAIQSILAQDYNNFELIISENTPDDTVVKQLDEYLKDSRVLLIKRSPSLASLEHFNTILAEADKYEYVMLFHDDDILMPQAFKKMMQTLENNITATAVACNALIIKNKEHTNTLLSPGLKKNTEIKTQSELINRYIFRSLGSTPFPSYIYRTRLLKDLQLNYADGGKYSDTTFLIKLIKRGSFIWLSEPLLKYRQHSSNDSVQLDMNNILSLCLFFFKTSPKMIFKILFYYFKQSLKKILLPIIKKIN